MWLRSLASVRSLATVAPSTWGARAGLLVAAATAVHWIVATTTGLSDTEAYYAQWARSLSLSYYDHPPLVAWTTWLARHFATGAWAVRLGPVAYATAFDVLLYRLAVRLFSPRAGFFALAIVSAIPAFFFTGFLVNPEGLLAPLWTLFLLCLLDLRDKQEPWRPLAAGAALGFAFLAKYTALCAVPVALLYVAGSPRTRRWLRRPSFYGAGVVALAIASPVVVWNALEGWPTLRLHLSERMTRPAGETLGGALVRVATGQLVVFQPLILVGLFAVLAFALLRARRDERYRFLATASLPVLAFLFAAMARAGDSEPHWTMVAYAPLAVGAGGLLDESTGRLARWSHRYLRAALVLSAGVAILYLVHLASPALARALLSYDPNADPINETLGWERVATAVGAHAGRLGHGTVVAGAHNVLCGHLQAALDDAPPVYCASPRRTEYDFLGRRKPPEAAPVVYVNSDRYPDDPGAALPRHRCVHVQDVTIERSGLRVGRYRIHECLPAGAAP
jgi:4-amino-4-deoxy-L-arabinose transferase-like glycosyltransferase